MPGIGVKDQTQCIGPGVVGCNLAVHVFGVVAVAGNRFRATHEASTNRQLHGVVFLLAHPAAHLVYLGSDAEQVLRLDPLFAALAPGMGDIPRTKDRVSSDDRAERGYIHAGPAGAGHFVKMIHNGIEYGMMQAFAEGFDILKTKSSEILPEDQRFDLNVADIAEVWRRGSVVSSWLLDLTADALASDPKLDGFSGSVADSGEGRWTIEAAMEQAVPVPVLSSSLFSRYRSRQQGAYGDKILSAMRFGFGGHVETPKK